MILWKELEFEKAFFDMTAKAHKVDQGMFLKSGGFPIIDQGQMFIAGYSNDDMLVWKRQLPVIIFGDHSRIVKYINFPFVLGADGTKVLEINNELFPLFAYYQLLSHEIPSAGYSRHFKFLKEWVVRFPPYAEQQRIAALLQKADRLRQLRRYTRQLSDGYLHSIFLEMFGDLETNSKGWNKGYVDDVIKSSQYGTSKKSNSENRGYPILGMANITSSGRLDLTNLTHVDLLIDEYRELRLEPGDIIFNRTNSTELVGKTTYWNLDREAVLASYLIRIKLKQTVIPEFFAFLMNTSYYKTLFRKRCKKAVGQSNISPTLLREFPMFIPPLEIQQRFSVFINQQMKLEKRQTESLRQSEHLFQSLLHQVFQGDK